MATVHIPLVHTVHKMQRSSHCSEMSDLWLSMFKFVARCPLRTHWRRYVLLEKSFFWEYGRSLEALVPYIECSERGTKQFHLRMTRSSSATLDHVNVCLIDWLGWTTRTTYMQISYSSAIDILVTDEPVRGPSNRIGCKLTFAQFSLGRSWDTYWWRLSRFFSPRGATRHGRDKEKIMKKRER